MTEFIDGPATDEALEEALARIDQGLTTLTSREVLTATEVSDLLLDLRLLLMTASPEAAAEPAPVPVDSTL